jgi:hypothetical protein
MLAPMNKPWRPALVFSVLTACSGSGLDGPAYAPLTGGSRLCFAINLGSGIQDAAKVSAAFNGLNRCGAFDPLAPVGQTALDAQRQAVDV